MLIVRFARQRIHKIYLSNSASLLDCIHDNKEIISSKREKIKQCLLIIGDNNVFNKFAPSTIVIRNVKASQALGSWVHC
ncbi:hypothetical protein, partial [Psychrobacter sp. 1U2]|uniref:hypothetical protein n=1 Tax=Psychrobacter sp. 1U2 TaxID=3453577 RepID=UPI003F6DF698